MGFGLSEPTPGHPNTKYIHPVDRALLVSCLLVAHHGFEATSLRKLLDNRHGTNNSSSRVLRAEIHALSDTASVPGTRTPPSPPEPRVKMSGSGQNLPLMDLMNSASASQPGTGPPAATYARPASDSRAIAINPPPETFVIDSNSNFDSAEEFMDPNNGTLASIANSQTITLSITSTYSNAWGPVEAFREVVQNWYC